MASRHAGRAARRDAPVEPRLLARARAVRRWRRRPLLVRVAGLALVAVAAWVVLASPVLAVRSVDVAGTHRLTPGAVRAAADVPRGLPLARVDLEAVRRRVAALPEVAGVEVRREWPRTVSLTVRERVAVAAVARGGMWLLVDAAGVGFATERTRPPAAVELAIARPGPDDPATRAALAVVAALPPALLRDTVRVQAASADDVRLRLRTGATVVWGSAADSGRKAAALAALVRRSAAAPVRVYDVSSPDVVTTS